MGNFFTSTQIYNSDAADRSKFIDTFCKAMKTAGYVTCDGEEAEKSYILKFADNCKWVTITSEEYGEGNQTALSDTGRIAKMLKTSCVNTTVIDSDCAVMALYAKSGQKANTLVIGRADDYFGRKVPKLSKDVWKPFLADESSWEKFCEIVEDSENYIFIEDGLSELAPLIGMDDSNILFSAEDAKEDDKQTVFLSFKEARSAITMSKGGKIVENPNKKLTINTAFKKIFSEALEPYGFKAIKGKYPYLVRVINNEILHIITFYPNDPQYPYDKVISVSGGVATVYRKRISFDKSPKQNHEWLPYASKFYTSLFNEYDRRIRSLLFGAGYHSDNTESMVTVLKELAEMVKKYVLPVLDEVNDIDSCLDYLYKFKMPRNTNLCKKICDYYPDEDEGFLHFLSEKKISERPDFLDNYINNSEFHNWVLNEIEKRKKENIDILKTLDIID